MAFPPIPVYPQAIDSDHTLYTVYNTTETKLFVDNLPWSQEISIIPVLPDKPEIWANNGFGNIEDELFYYDSVELNSHGKVHKLKGCARQIGSVKTKFNQKGTWTRSFVVAEHHNQLVTSILKTQNFIGYNFTPDMSTLDWRIRNLQSLDVIFDDFSCPDIDFTFNIVSNDPVAGILAEYFVQLTPPGSVSSFRLDFGDGEFTTTNLNGQHRYALNARIDPVIRASNDKCQIIQTPIERDNPSEPPAEIAQVFNVPIPPTCDIPVFTFVPCTVPPPDIVIPSIVSPCISITGQIGPIPSVITGPNINLVSQVTITSSYAINITQSVVTVIGVPSLIMFDQTIPATIIIDPPIPPTIVIVPLQSNITLDLNIGDLPRFEMDWGNVPNMEVQLTMAKAVKAPAKFAASASLMNEFGPEFGDIFEIANTTEVQYEPAGIPTEINVIVPDLPDFKIDYGDLFNQKIKLDTTSVNIPTDIIIHGPKSPIPNSIKFDASDVPESISLIFNGDPIQVDASGIPTSIEVNSNIPNHILVEMVKPIPEKIIVESNIPDTITLIGPTSIPISIPEGIGLPLLFPEQMPELPIAAYRGPPIELKITMDNILSSTNQGKYPCIMMVPCV